MTTYSTGGGDLKIDYRALPLAGKRARDAGTQLTKMLTGALATADAVSLYPQDPLITARLPTKLGQVKQRLAKNKTQLEFLGRRMQAIGKAAELADNADFKTQVTDHTGAVDHEASLIFFLMEQGETQLAMEASLFDPGDRINFTVTADGRVRAWKIVDIGVESAATMSIQLLPEGRFGDDRYQLSLSGQYELFGGAGVDKERGDADGSVDGQIGGGPKATIIFRSEDAAEIAANVDDVRTIVLATHEISTSIVSSPLPLLSPPIGIGLAVVNANAARGRIDEATKRLEQDYDAVEIGARYNVEAGASGKYEVPSGTTILGKPIGSTQAVALNGQVVGNAEVIYHHERHQGNGGDSVILRTTQKVSGEVGVTDALKVDAGSAELSAGRTGSGTIQGTETREIKYNIDSERFQVVVTVDGQVGTKLAESLDVKAADDGPKGQVKHSTGSGVGRRVTMVFEPQDAEFGELVEALDSGDYEGAFEAIGGTKIQVSDVRTGSESLSASAGVPNVVEGSVTASATIVDVEPRSLWEPPEPTPPPPTEPPVPDIIIEDPPPRSEPEPELKKPDTADMPDSEAVNDRLTRTRAVDR